MTPGLARNIEVKARCRDLDSAADACKALGAAEAGDLAQKDTYFRVPHGRLKLRETAGSAAELIWYVRSDDAQPRQCDYLRIPTEQPELLGQALASALGIAAVVSKQRRLLIFRNVRIHLDRVSDLGAFVEFEAVIDDGHSEAEGHQSIKLLCDAAGIASGDFERGSYAELLTRRG